MFVPSWCLHLCQLNNGKIELTEIPSTGIDQSDRGLAAFMVNETLVNTHLVGEVADLARSQRADKLLNSVIEVLESGKYTAKQDADLDKVLVKSEDLRSKELLKQASKLKMCQTTSLLVKSEEKTVQIVLPTSEVGKYLRNVHDSNGHAGYDICKSRLRNFWWPGLAEDLRNYVRSCSICASRKGRYGQRAPQIGVCEKGLKP